MALVVSALGVQGAPAILHDSSEPGERAFPTRSLSGPGSPGNVDLRRCLKV